MSNRAHHSLIGASRAVRLTLLVAAVAVAGTAQAQLRWGSPRRGAKATSASRSGRQNSTLIASRG